MLHHKCMMAKAKWLMLLLLFATGATHAEEAAVSENLELRRDAKNAFYTYNYPSVDADGNPIVLSSAMVSWRPSYDPKDSIETVLIFCHVTITTNYECPSSYMDEGSLGSDVGIIQTLPVMGLTYERLRHSIIIMPDYEGYGVTKDRPHPYLSQRLTARQVVDAVTYGLQLYQKLVEACTNPPLQSDWKTFCMGYSQGGAVALATQRHIEENGLSEELHFSGSLCCSGPYDLVANMQYYVEDDGNSHGVSTAHRKNKLSMPVVMPLILKGMCDTHPDMKAQKLTDYFSKKFLDTGIIGWIEDKAKDKSEQKKTDDITKLFYEQAEKGLTASDGTVYTPQEMQQMFTTHSRSFGITGYTYIVYADMREVLRSDCYKYLSNRDSMAIVPEQPCGAMQNLHRALVDNSLVEGWEPQHRIVFLHSKYDTIVPYDNYESFVAAHPDADYRHEELSGDHLDAATSFFSGLLTTGYKKHFEWLAEGPQIPTDIISLQSNPSEASRIYDLSGRQVVRRTRHGIYIQHGRKVVY